jgi:lipopolysaccharide transport system permease protein
VRSTLVEIEPSRGLRRIGLAELWAYRDLLFFFVWRDVKVRYKQTFFGATWAIIQPLILMVVFTFVFGRVLNVRTPPGIPKPIFYYAGLVPWTLFATSLNDAAASLVTNATLVRKIYFPRLILPISAVGSATVDFVIALSIVFVMLILYGLGVPWKAFALPAFAALTILTAISFGLWVSALNAIYRDVRYVVPFVVQVMLFLTPVFFPVTQLPENIRPLYFMNPMVGVVEGFRWALIDGYPAPEGLAALSAVITMLVLVGGLVYFRTAERTFSDVI